MNPELSSANLNFSQKKSRELFRKLNERFHKGFPDILRY